MADHALTLLGIIGLASQFAASVLLVTLYGLLGRAVRRRSYFRQWGRAWLVLMITLGLLVLRYQALPMLHGSGARGLVVDHGMLALYQLGKLLWCALLVAGTVQYAHRVRRPRLLTVGVLAAIAYGAVSSLASESLEEVIVWQSPLATAALGYCAVLLLRLPVSRRTLGSRFTGLAFAANGLLWAVYGPAFLAVVRQPSPRSPLLAALLSGHSFLDQIAGIALGYGMIVVLLEDAKREADAAHAELAVAHHELRRGALIDPLTGTLNRRAFEEGVGLDLARGTFGAVGVIDLDGLKVVNDTQGHAAGDALLRRLADVVLGGLRPSDKLYRWGGDEFLLIMPGASRDDLCRRVDALLANAPAIQASIGAADYEGAEGLARAIPLSDRAMYEEKGLRKRSAATAGEQAAG